jgi:hypothetical protein
LPDVSLDVGMPTILTREHKFDAEVGLGSWLISNLSDFTNPSTNITDRAMLMFLRIRRIDATGLPIDAGGRQLPK